MLEPRTVVGYCWKLSINRVQCLCVTNRATTCSVLAGFCPGAVCCLSPSVPGSSQSPVKVRDVLAFVTLSYAKSGIFKFHINSLQHFGGFSLDFYNSIISIVSYIFYYDFNVLELQEKPLVDKALILMKHATCFWF